MKIKRDVIGWVITPETNTEESHLEFLIEALDQRYGDGAQKAEGQSAKQG